MTHAKAIFFGEHAVVYGYKGITIPLPQMTVDVELKETNIIQKRDEIISFISDICGINDRTEININSTIPVGRGLGSSAALSIAIARAKKLTNIREIANKCEKFIHGNPSGIDVNQVLSDTPLLFSKKDALLLCNTSFLFILSNQQIHLLLLAPLNLVCKYIMALLVYSTSLINH